MKNPTLVVALILTLLFAGALAWRISTESKDFEDMVKESLKTSEGYDEKFEKMVNRLEEILATRAEFGYTGNKDPMTGKKRRVVRVKRGKKKSKKKGEEKVEIDPVKLTAIIEDDDGVYTAVVMNGDRSLSVSQGDKVRNRIVTSITEDMVIMQDSQFKYKYDIAGNKFKKPLIGSSSPPVTEEGKIEVPDKLKKEDVLWKPAGVSEKKKESKKKVPKTEEKEPAKAKIEVENSPE